MLASRRHCCEQQLHGGKIKKEEVSVFCLACLQTCETNGAAMEIVINMD
jgi:hypothetical protein